MDIEACRIATSMKDAWGALPSIYPAADMASCMDDYFGHAASSCGIEDTTGRIAPAPDAPDAPSFACSPMDVAIGCASPVDAMAAPMPLTLTTGVALVGS